MQQDFIFVQQLKGRRFLEELASIHDQSGKNSNAIWKNANLSGNVKLNQSEAILQINPINKYTTINIFC